MLEAQTAELTTDREADKWYFNGGRQTQLCNLYRK